MNIPIHALCFLSILTITVSCQQIKIQTDCDGGVCDGQTSSTHTCVAIRGNGPLISSHWHSLARITEEYGAPVGVAGGSSASVTAFLYESILLNPLVRASSQRDQRIALLLKSLVAVPRDFAKEASVLQGMPNSVKELKALLSKNNSGEENVADLSREQLLQLGATVMKYIDADPNEDLKVFYENTILNKDFATLFATSYLELDSGIKIEKNVFILNDLIRSVRNFGSFDSPQNEDFVRPGLLDFSVFALWIGKIADFYAAGDYGYGVDNDMHQWLLRWSEATSGLSWPEIEDKHPQCESEFLDLFATAQKEFSSSTIKSKTRIKENIGENLATLIMTSVIADDGAKELDKARMVYLAGDNPTIDVQWGDVYFGYWGGHGDDADAVAGLLADGDPKGEKALALGNTHWHEALSLSPAEPGLASVLPLGENMYSAGGWSDLHPVGAMRHVPGCNNVIYLTRRGEDSNFARGAAAILGNQDSRPFSDLESSGSSFSRAIDEAEVVWCTDWDTIDKFDFLELANDAYLAPAQVNIAAISPNYSHFMSYPRASENIALTNLIDATGCLR